MTFFVSAEKHKGTLENIRMGVLKPKRMQKKPPCVIAIAKSAHTNMAS